MKPIFVRNGLPGIVLGIGLFIILTMTSSAASTSCDPNQPGDACSAAYQMNRAQFSVVDSYSASADLTLNEALMPCCALTDPGLFILSGRITLNGTGMGNVAVANGSGLTATTASDGSYTFHSLPPGSYTLTPSKSGYHFTPPNRVVTAGPDVANLDFTAAHDVTIIRIPMIWRGYIPPSP